MSEHLEIRKKPVSECAVAATVAAGCFANPADFDLPGEQEMAHHGAMNQSKGRGRKVVSSCCRLSATVTITDREV